MKKWKYLYLNLTVFSRVNLNFTRVIFNKVEYSFGSLFLNMAKNEIHPVLSHLNNVQGYLNAFNSTLLNVSLSQKAYQI